MGPNGHGKLNYLCIFVDYGETEKTQFQSEER